MPNKDSAKLREHNSLDGLFTKVLMEQHAHDWSMETVREAALICSNALLLNYSSAFMHDHDIEVMLDRHDRDVAVLGYKNHGYSTSAAKLTSKFAKELEAHTAAQVAAADVDARKAMGARLNQAIFYSTTQPDGQFVKDCILAELNSAEKDKLAHLTTEPQETCAACGGDGKETCNNPDHGFIDALSGVGNGDIQRIGCPGCDHDPEHKVINGGDCEDCNGTGLTTGQKEKA
jgi:hypothetical protein